MDVQDLTTEQTGSATTNMQDLSFKMDDAGSHTKDDSDVSHLDTPAQPMSDRILTKSQSDTSHYTPSRTVVYRREGDPLPRDRTTRSETETRNSCTH
jgi:hypothetical protein